MSARKIETKEFPFTLTKMDEEEGTFTGYASVWDVVDSYGDIVVKGAFKRTLKNKGQFPILWSHNIMEPIGTIAGKEDAKGLLVEGRLTRGVQRASELRELMKDKAVNGLSIGYQTLKEENDRESGTRRLLEINLWEISLCVFQACPGAEVGEVKALAPEEMKPYPSEHSCRLRSPDDFRPDSFRRTTRKHKDKTYSVIMAKLKGEDTMTEQAYRYDKDEWTAAEAKAHCKEHEGSFEAASGKCEHCFALLDEDSEKSALFGNSRDNGIIVDALKGHGDFLRDLISNKEKTT